MKRTQRTPGTIAALAFLFVSRPAAAPAGPPPPARATCAFSNPAYSGQCIENADVPQGSTPQQACEQILSCLNNVDCLKTYCQATTIRSGWQLVSAK